MHYTQETESILTNHGQFILEESNKYQEQSIKCQFAF